jgi:hypothetical protein
MRTFMSLALLIVLAAVGRATEPEDTWSLRDIGDGLYSLEFDSVGTKCLVVEFDTSLCLIEVALSNKGGGAGELTEHREGGEAILEILREHFPEKPLGIVLHSHWHPHSIASVAPFLEAGVTLVTTRANFERVREFVDSSLIETRPDLIRFVEGDSLVIGKGPRAIVIYRLQKENYPTVPSPDYLFFYLPGHRALHCGCMYNKWRGKPVDGREILTTREQDLYKFINAKGLGVDGLIRVTLEDDTTGQVLPYAGLADVISNGVTARELTAPFTELDTDALRADRDRLVVDAISRNIPGRLFNSLVYNAIGKQDLARAKEFALLQVLISPSNANGWDTLGEVYYFLGQWAVARAYAEQSRRIDPKYSGGGEEAWAQDLIDYQKKWDEESGYPDSLMKRTD